MNEAPAARQKEGTERCAWTKGSGVRCQVAQSASERDMECMTGRGRERAIACGGDRPSVAVAVDDNADDHVDDHVD